MLGLNAIDPLRLPADLLTPRFVVLPCPGSEQAQQPPDRCNGRSYAPGKRLRNKFTTQMGVDWVIAEYDKLSKLVDANTKSVG